jgi:hypothetical protein
MAEDEKIGRGSSPASRGGAGVYIEGELGAYYLLAMLAGTEARGMPGAKITSLRFQGVDQGYAMDDLIVQGAGSTGAALLEIQSKRDISFSPKDAIFAEVAAQIARSRARNVSEDRHLLAVATQRQSKSISGPYQDVLIWARAAESGREFFDRVEAKGVGSDPMRTFISTFRGNLVGVGVADDDDVIWKLLRLRDPRFRLRVDGVPCAPPRSGAGKTGTRGRGCLSRGEPLERVNRGHDCNR